LIGVSFDVSQGSNFARNAAFAVLISSRIAGALRPPRRPSSSASAASVSLASPMTACRVSY